MIRPEDARIEKTMQVMEGLGLSTEELEKIEGYLRDETGEEILKTLTFRNLETVDVEARNKCKELTNDWQLKKRYAELEKVFKILFALGESTAASTFTQNIMILREKDFQEQLKMEKAKLVSVYAQYMGGTRWFRNIQTLDGLYILADSRTEILTEALKYYKGSNAAGRLLIYTVYFWKKYKADMTIKVPTIPQNPSQETTQKKGFLNSIAQMFGSKSTADVPAENHSTHRFSGEDAEWMNQYENIMVSNLAELFSNTVSDDTLKQLQDAVRKGKVDSALLQKVKGTTLQEYLLQMIGGCAFLNYMLSDVLKAVVTLCMVADTTKSLDAFLNINGRNDFVENAGNYDTLFQAQPIDLLRWATESNHNYGYSPKAPAGVAKSILTIQLQKNQELYMQYMRQTSLEGSNRMLNVVKEVNPNLHQGLVDSGMEAQKNKAIQIITNGLSAATEAAEYLRGERTLAELPNLMAGSKYAGSTEWRAVESYQKTYQDREFYVRVMVLMALREMGYFFRQPLNGRAVNMTKEVTDIFRCFQEGGLGIATQLHMLVVINDTFYSDSDKKMLLNSLVPIFGQYLKDCKEETVQAFAEAEAYGRYFALCVYEKDAENYKEQILGFSQDSAKMVKEKLEDILKTKEEWRKEVSGLLKAKKAAERELGIRVLLHWNTQEDLELLHKLLETEKNTKIRNLLESTLQIPETAEGVAAPVKVLTVEELIKNLHKGGKKRSLAWAYETPFSPVHTKMGAPAEEEHLQAILLCYTGMSVPGVSKDAQILAEELDETEFAGYVNELFDKWLAAGAEAKKRWVMYAASIHGGSDMVRKLHHQIQEWPQNARGAIAADAVQALALSPNPQALLLVDSIARKFKFKQVRAAAGNALEFAAAQLGLTREELEDKIVPDLGFDEKMERKFDYGERCFTVMITPALEIEVFDAEGKKLKNLPAPGKKDDEEKANEAYADFKEMKKQMKTTISSQKMRLEAALSAERLWSISAWQELFVKNPVMHQFAIGLIWGIYEEHKLVQTFRYMEDGSFNTEDEDEYTLPQEGYIGLVHPIELSEESKKAWKQQLEDYEITQPFEQLDREIYYCTEEEAKRKSIERFGGMYVNDFSLIGKMQQLGWYKGEVLDGGCFDIFYRQDNGLGLRAQLHFSGSYVGGMGEDVTIYTARFYKAGEDHGWGWGIDDENKDTKALPLKDIPARYFSEIVLQLTRATASSKERDENWKKNRR